MNEKDAKTIKRVIESNMAVIVWADNIKKVKVAQNKVLEDVIHSMTKKGIRRVA